MLRVIVYVLLVASAALFVFSMVMGAKTVRDTALSSLKISAETSAGTTQCKDGEVVYGVHNYPFTSVPKDSGAHAKYTDKMPDGTFRCSAVCGPSDPSKFATEVVSKLTVGGEKMNVVANKSEFDALVAKQSSKSELLDRTMILEYSLQRRGLGCFGPSMDYKNLQGATVAKANTTYEDQKKAEEERKKKAEEAKKQSGTSGTGSDYQGTAAGNPNDQTLQAPTGGGSQSTDQSSSTQQQSEQQATTSLYDKLPDLITINIKGTLMYSAKSPSKRGVVCAAISPARSSLIKGTGYNACTTAPNGGFETSLKLRKDGIMNKDGSLNFQNILIYAVDTGGMMKGTRNALASFSLSSFLDGKRIKLIDLGVFKLEASAPNNGGLLYPNGQLNNNRPTANQVKQMFYNSTKIDCLSQV